MIIIIVIILIIAVLIFIFRRNKKNNQIKILIRQTARWTVAASQDTMPLVSVLHANYGVGYLMALKDLFTHREIEKETGINLHKFEQEILKTQDKITKRLSKICPKYTVNNSVSNYLLKIAGDI
jgi:hypothetical protein